MQNNTQKSASAVITPEDIRQLAENVQDLETAIGRDILHAQRNGDDVGCMVQNILADIEVLLVNNFGTSTSRITFRRPASTRMDSLTMKSRPCGNTTRTPVSDRLSMMKGRHDFTEAG